MSPKLSPELSAQVGGINVRTVNFQFSPQINISRGSAVSVAGDDTKRAEKVSNESTLTPAKGRRVVSDTAKELHPGPTLGQQVRISGKSHTIVHPRSDGSFYIVYTKTQSSFTLTSPAVEPSKSSKETESPPDRAVQDIDGYKLTFWAQRQVKHEEIVGISKKSDRTGPALAGIPLRIYRPRRGPEYFLLVNCYFEPLSDEGDADIKPSTETTATMEEVDRGSRTNKPTQKNNR